MLRGIGQVVFMPNTAAGALILLAVLAAALRGSVPAAMPAGLVAAVAVGTLTARALRADPEALASGLHGFNPALVGLALPLMVRMDIAGWALLVAAAAASAALALALGRLLARAGLPGLTAPFILVTWAAVAVTAPVAPGTALPDQGPAVAALRGVAQIFLVPDAACGALLLAALAVASRTAAPVAAGAAALSVLAARALALPAGTVGAGRWSYSPVLTALAMGVAFPMPGRRGAAWTLAATLATIPVQAALAPLAAAAGVPLLTAPFVLTTWAALSLRRAIG